MSFTCLFCQEQFEEFKKFSYHVLYKHKTKIEDYLIKFNYDGVRPVCKECGGAVEYSKQARDFNKFCKVHANLGRSLWSKNNGFGVGMDPKQNLGKTKENCSYMKERSERMQGVGVKVFSKEEIKENTAKRLETEQERGSRKVKIEKYDKYLNMASSVGLELASDLLEIKDIKSVVKFKCKICGEVFERKVNALYQNRKEQTLGCPECTRKQVGEINADLFRKTLEEFNRDVAWVLENLSFRILTPYDQYSSIRTKLDVECTKCGKVSHKSLGSMIINKNKCYYCSKQGKSQWEVDIRDALIAKYPVTVSMHNKIGRKEIDLIVENGDKKVGVELNGLYWHSENEKDDKYHYEKYIMAKENGFPLIQIFEDEWRDKKDLILSMIAARVGIVAKIKAKDCIVAPFDPRSKVVAEFFAANHISGPTRNCEFVYGLTQGDKVVSMISFRKPFVKKYGAHVIEIARFATLAGYSVEYGFSRLMKHAVAESRARGYESILSYADLRFGEGNTYKWAGFTLLGHTQPDYYYTDFENRFNRFKYRATATLTERQVAEQNDVVKIHGAGNNIWLLALKI